MSLFSDRLGILEVPVYNLSDDSGHQTRIPESLEDAEIVCYNLSGALRVVHDSVNGALYVEWRNAASQRIVGIRLDEIATRMAQAAMADRPDQK